MSDEQQQDETTQPALPVGTAMDTAREFRRLSHHGVEPLARAVGYTPSSADSWRIVASS